MTPLRASAKDHVRIPGPTAARLFVDVHRSYYQKRSCRYLWNWPSPEVILLFKDLAAAKAMPIWVAYSVTQDHDLTSGLKLFHGAMSECTIFYTWSSCWWQWDMLTLGAMPTKHVEIWDQRWGNCPSLTLGDLALSLDCCCSKRTGPNPHGENWPCPTRETWPQ